MQIKAGSYAKVREHRFLELNGETVKILRLQFPSFLTLKDGYKLQINDKIDHRHSCGKFYIATVCEKQDSNLKIHYDKLPEKFDIWSDFRCSPFDFSRQDIL